MLFRKKTRRLLRMFFVLYMKGISRHCYYAFTKSKLFQSRKRKREGMDTLSLSTVP
jgi:hypothetical protein